MVSSLSRSDVNGDTRMDFFHVNVRHTVTMHHSDILYLQIPECICPLSLCRNIHRRRGGPLVPRLPGSCKSRSQTCPSWWWRWFRGHWSPSLGARSPPPAVHSPWSVKQGDTLSQTYFFSNTMNSFCYIYSLSDKCCNILLWHVPEVKIFLSNHFQIATKSL